MIDIDKQVRYWSDSSKEDWAVASELIERGRIRHGLFFAHLAVEKMLKSLVCRRTRDMSPPIHNLGRLAEIAGVALTLEQADLLAEMNAFNIEGRYPGLLAPPPAEAEVHAYVRRITEVLQWLTGL